ncbi:MAG: tRNA (N6-isopentenyl adenosine(37)-C2)-methylthiotransferase MiaB [Pelagibacteraceae bacterium]
MSKKIFIKTFGCQMNEYDSNRILDLVKTIDYSLTTNLAESDCYVLNTCHIREKATEKVFHDIGRVKKNFRNKKKPILIVTGCVAQAEGEELLKKENYIDGVVGPQSYHDIPGIIKRAEIKKNKFNSTDFNTIEKFDHLKIIKNSNSKVSSYLTIQEGCDKFCHFCVVPYTRGPEFSRSFSEIILEAKQLVNNGSKEITLLGQNVNAYKYDKYKLSDLINKLNNIKGLERIRYTTSHPRDVSDDLMDAHRDCDKLMPLLHLPVQSGSDKILKAMNRKHNIEYYLNIVEKLKKKNKLLKFSSDFIIGYPGETSHDFKETIDLVKKVKFINSYSFIYSVRPGTPASNLIIPDLSLSKKRLEEFQKISNEIKNSYRKNILNNKVKVLFENKIKNENLYFGRDEHHNSVIVKSEIDLVGKINDVEINNFNRNTLFGDIILISNKKKVIAA